MSHLLDGFWQRSSKGLGQEGIERIAKSVSKREMFVCLTVLRPLKKRFGDSLTTQLQQVLLLFGKVRRTRVKGPGWQVRLISPKSFIGAYFQTNDQEKVLQKWTFDKPRRKHLLHPTLKSSKVKKNKNKQKQNRKVHVWWITDDFPNPPQVSVSPRQWRSNI